MGQYLTSLIELCTCVVFSYQELEFLYIYWQARRIMVYVQVVYH